MEFLSWLFLCCLCGILFEIKSIETASLSVENVKINNDHSMETFANQMSSLMNISADPCDNFYNFACGNFSNQCSIFRDIDSTIIEQLDAILTKQRNHHDKYFEELQIAKKFVDTCSSTKLIPIEPSVEYLEVLNSIGGFPAIDATWNESSFDWFNMTAHLVRYGIVGLVEEVILPIYPFNPVFKLPILGFGFDVYLENIATNESDGYIYNANIMDELLQAYGVSVGASEEIIEEIFDFWREIEKLKSQIPVNNATALPSSCAQLSFQPFDDWNNLFEIAWETKDFRIDYPSYCPCAWFFNQLNELAKEKSKAFANYMALKFLYTMHPRLKSEESHRRDCISIAKASMPTVFSYFYMLEHYKKHDEPDIIQLTLELQTSWMYRIADTDWVDNSSRKEALKKLKTLKWNVGHIADTMFDFYIKQIKNLNITENFAMNMLQLSKFKVNMRHNGKLHPNGNRNATQYELLDVARTRAFNRIWENNINFLAGLLQPQIYDRDFPSAVNYGRLGYIIGHEMAHSFAGKGFVIDASLMGRNWLSEDSLKVSKEKSNCFRNDYEMYKEPEFDHKFDGRRVLSEIEADSAGLSVALSAYKEVLEFSGEIESASLTSMNNELGLNLTSEQTFFLAFSQIYCEKYEPRDYWNEIKAAHPLKRYRVLGTLKNSEEFAKAFNCPHDSAMNPKQKCRLW